MKTPSSNGPAPLHILQLEDNADDRLLVQKKLKQEGLNCRIQFAETQTAFETALARTRFHLVISDFSLPSYNGDAALAATRKWQPDTPFILLSGTVGEERAVEFLKQGAADCVLKENLARLGPVVRRALREAGERAQRKTAEAALHTLAGQLRALAARLQAVREEERIRISREIHDELGAALAAQKFGLEWIRQRLDRPAGSPPDRQIFEKVDALKALADGTAKRVRKLCTELRPPILDDLGLLAAIEWQVREFQANTNIRCELIHHLSEQEFKNEQATAVFRIFQEILTNIARHSGASRVRVWLKIKDHNLILQVRDNGKGIAADKISGSGSFGILGMRERALLMGGEVAIAGKVARGTVVTVSIPLNLPMPQPETAHLASSL